jgi:hypothetical protein
MLGIYTVITKPKDSITRREMLRFVHGGGLLHVTADREDQECDGEDHKDNSRSHPLQSSHDGAF